MNLSAAQWQGSGYTKELYHGSEALKKYIEKFGVPFNEIKISDSQEIQTEHDIIGYAMIEEQLDRIDKILKEKSPQTIWTIGGGCGIEVPIVSYFAEKESNLKIVWFDAHGDLNTPKSSPSKLFHGMPLRFLLEKIEGNAISEKFQRVETSNVILLGARDLDPAEESFITRNALKTISIEDHRRNGGHLKDLHNEKVYIHIDLDVLDPGEYRNVKCPSKNGFKITEVLKTLEGIQAQNAIIGVSILENVATDQRELEKIRELIEFCIKLSPCNP